MNKVIIALVAIVYLIISEIIPRISAMGFESKGVTLVLTNCKNESCYLHGTWKKDPVTLAQILELEDGSEVYFEIENIKLLTVPHNLIED